MPYSRIFIVTSMSSVAIQICTVCSGIENFIGFLKKIQEVSEIFKMAASIGLIEVRILIFGLIFFFILYRIWIEFVADCMV